jgi:predicted transcriptional regulator
MQASQSVPTVGVKIAPEMKLRLKNLAQRRNRTPHWVMREAIEQYVTREEKREEFNKATLQAWEEYQATGLHCTGDEADAWLDKLAAGEDVEPPICHL